MLLTHPAVFAVGKQYQIMVPVKYESTMWVEIAGQKFYDHSNGILCSKKRIHRAIVPMELLNRENEYTICTRNIIERTPYFPKLEDEERVTYHFSSPEGKENPRLYMIADAHNNHILPVKAAKVFGDIDLLVMNGDIPDHSGTIENFDTIYQIASDLTKGELPIVFARGNHDMRGIEAENFASHVPNQNGKSYYTFRLGAIWGIVLDCAEDKPDTNPEYGGTICCHIFREEQTEFLHSVIQNAADEYTASGVKYRLVISHHPFSYVCGHPFDIEQNIYREWCTLLKEYIKPDLMMAGHLHELFYSKPGSEYDCLGQPCDLVVGSKPEKECFTGCGITLKETVSVFFTDSDGNSLEASG